MRKINDKSRKDIGEIMVDKFLNFTKEVNNKFKNLNES